VSNGRCRASLFVIALIGADGCGSLLQFGVVQDAKGTAQVACGIEPPNGSSIVVAVLARSAIEDARFVVTPVAPPGTDPSTLKSSERAPVYIPADKPFCLRLPLPSVPASVRRFDISISGKSGTHAVTGGSLNCEPLPVTHWNCEPR
jgi:hypothetical protein